MNEIDRHGELKTQELAEEFVELLARRERELLIVRVDDKEGIEMGRRYIEAWSALVGKTYASRFCKGQLLTLPVPPDWRGWSGADAVQRAAKEFFLIDPKAKQYGFFGRRLALVAEAHYFGMLLPWLLWDVTEGLQSPIDCREWRKSLERRGAEINPQSSSIYNLHVTF